MSAVLAMQKTSELESVRWLLREWVRWRRRWRPALGYPGSVPYIHQIKGSFDSWTEGDDYDERIEGYQMRALERAIQDDLQSPHRHAIQVIYLREEVPVWRSLRLPMQEIRRLCGEAENLLIPALLRRHIVL